VKHGAESRIKSDSDPGVQTTMYKQRLQRHGTVIVKKP
jgi:hypothetical protein